MATTITDLDFDDDDDGFFDNSFDSGGSVVDNDDWDESSGNVQVNYDEGNSLDENGNGNGEGDNGNGDSGDNPDNPDNSDSNDNPPPTDFLSELLKSKGIQDSSKIKFENESGEIEEKDWKDLTIEEQLNIVSGEEEEGGNGNSNSDLDDNEIDLINRIRLSRMSVDDYIQYEIQKGIAGYIAQQEPEEPNYIVDDIPDDELYMLDLLTKVPDLTPEELELALTAAKENEILFNKQIAGIRNEYKELEENKKASQEAIMQQELQELFAQFSNSIINSINNFNGIGELDINMEDNDANELYLFITGTDPAGINYFAKALNDPDTLTRVAWFALHGEDVINSISDYYKGVISQVSKSQYEKGKQDAKGKTPKKEKATVVIQPKQNKSSKVTTIYDLD